MITVALEGLEFFGRHGVYAEEQETGNTFIVDLYLKTEMGEDGGDDDLKNVVDYGAVYKSVEKVMAVRKNLLESLVQGIAEELLMGFDEIEAVKVRVSKMNPPLGGTCQRSFVEAEWVRE